jgi:hypothetical protein
MRASVLWMLLAVGGCGGDGRPPPAPPPPRDVGPAIDDGGAIDARVEEDAARLDAGGRDGGGRPRWGAGDLLLATSSPDDSCRGSLLVHFDAETRTPTTLTCDDFDAIGVSGFVQAVAPYRTPCTIAQRVVLTLGGDGRFGAPPLCTDLHVDQMVGRRGGGYAALDKSADDCRFAAGAVFLFDPGRAVMTAGPWCGADWWGSSGATIAVEASGNVLVTARISGPMGVLERIDVARGTMSRIATYPDADAPATIAAGPDRRIYASANGGGAGCFRARILQLDPDTGAVEHELCDERLWSPAAMAVSPDGATLYVADLYSTSCAAQGALFLVATTGGLAVAETICAPDLYRPRAIASL